MMERMSRDFRQHQVVVRIRFDDGSMIWKGEAKHKKMVYGFKEEKLLYEN